jgi:hypothetical protein
MFEVSVTQDNFETPLDWIHFLESNDIPLRAVRIVRTFKNLAEGSDLANFIKKHPTVLNLTGTIVGKE